MGKKRRRRREREKKMLGERSSDPSAVSFFLLVVHVLWESNAATDCLASIVSVSRLLVQMIFMVIHWMISLNNRLDYADRRNYPSS